MCRLTGSWVEHHVAVGIICAGEGSTAGSGEGGVVLAVLISDRVLEMYR